MLVRSRDELRCINGMWWMFDMFPKSVDPDNPFGLSKAKMRRAEDYMSKFTSTRTPYFRSKIELLDYLFDKYKDGRSFTVYDVDPHNRYEFYYSRRVMAALLMRDSRFKPVGTLNFSTATHAKVTKWGVSL